MSKKDKPKFRMTGIDEIRPYERNPRIIPQAAVDAVAKSIQAFGFRQPIVVDGEGVILAGHTRYKAALQLGLRAVPVVWETDIDEVKARGYRIADNKTAEISAWDRDVLDEEIRELSETDLDLESLGIEGWELDRILDDTTLRQTEGQADSHQRQCAKREAYEPYSLGIRSGTLKTAKEEPKHEDDACVGAVAVKIIFKSRDHLERAKESIDKAVIDGEGEVYPCEP